jgi:hypothetical protein
MVALLDSTFKSMALDMTHNAHQKTLNALTQHILSMAQVMLVLLSKIQT